VWDLANDRCSSGPFAVRESELDTLRSALTDLAAEEEQAA
jgi:hypothetical protein